LTLSTEWPTTGFIGVSSFAGDSGLWRCKYVDTTSVPLKRKKKSYIEKERARTWGIVKIGRRCPHLFVVVYIHYHVFLRNYIIPRLHPDSIALLHILLWLRVDLQESNSVGLEFGTNKVDYFITIIHYITLWPSFMALFLGRQIRISRKGFLYSQPHHSLEALVLSEHRKYGAATPISTFDGADNQSQVFETFQVQTGTCSSPNVYLRFHISL
jgi:hypothetical protein